MTPLSPSMRTIKTALLTAAVTTITIGGTLYGAELKTQQVGFHSFLSLIYISILNLKSIPSPLRNNDNDKTKTSRRKKNSTLYDPHETS